MMRCLALFSGSLDSMLAVRLMQEQNIDVVAVTFQTWFTCSSDTAQEAAAQLDVALHTVGADVDFEELLRRPQFGFGRAANPCIDCRVYMLRKALNLREPLGAEFIVTGEVAGQRAFGQKRIDLETIAAQINHRAADVDRVLRPLSARLLPPTLPERAGWVDRQRLYDFSGQSRRPLIHLANQIGINAPTSPQSSCRLTDTSYGTRLFELLRSEPAPTTWDYELLPVGRHLRLHNNDRAIVGKNASDNEQLRAALQTAPHDVTLVEAVSHRGPTLLHIGKSNALELRPELAALLRRYAKWGDDTVTLRATHGDGTIAEWFASDAPAQ